jgi:hypothetical protein
MESITMAVKHPMAVFCNEQQQFLGFTRVWSEREQALLTFTSGKVYYPAWSMRGSVINAVGEDFPFTVRPWDLGPKEGTEFVQYVDLDSVERQIKERLISLLTKYLGVPVYKTDFASYTPDEKWGTTGFNYVYLPHLEYYSPKIQKEFSRVVTSEEKMEQIRREIQVKFDAPSLSQYVNYTGFVRFWNPETKMFDTYTSSPINVPIRLIGDPEFDFGRFIFTTFANRIGHARVHDGQVITNEREFEDNLKFYRPVPNTERQFEYVYLPDLEHYPLAAQEAMSEYIKK